MQQQQQPGGPVPTYRNVQGVRTEPPNQRTTYNVQRTTYGTYSVLSIPDARHVSPLDACRPAQRQPCISQVAQQLQRHKCGLVAHSHLHGNLRTLQCEWHAAGIKQHSRLWKGLLQQELQVSRYTDRCLH
jgi:hypothetical protein